MLSRWSFLGNCDPLVFCEFSCPAVSTMLSRGLRTSGYDLPGAESTAVPLTGYRPLSHDSSSLADQLGRDSSNNKLKPAQVSQHVVTWVMWWWNIYHRIVCGSFFFNCFFVPLWVWYCFLCVVFRSFCFYLSSVCGSSFHPCPHCFHLSSLTCVWSLTSVNPVKGCVLGFRCFCALFWVCVLC